MFGFPTDEPDFNVPINRLLSAMSDHETDSKEFAEHVRMISELSKVKRDQRATKVSPDVVLNTLGSLAGIIMILKHEQLNVITTKALSFIPKIR